jgi:nitrogenase subunit NifH
MKIPFLGKIPIDPTLTQCCEEGKNYLDMFPDSPSLETLKNFANKLVEQDRAGGKPTNATKE